MQRMNARLCQRIAQEAQLLAEEKWIIEALRKLKQQRNSLQIERLHLESLRKNANNDIFNNKITAAQPCTEEVVKAPSAPSTEEPKQAPPPEEPAIVTTLSQFDVAVAGIDDEMCNNEKLNLSVTDSVFTNQQLNSLDMEEDEEDLDNGLEDEEYMENALLEMNLLMNASSN